MEIKDYFKKCFNDSTDNKYKDFKGWWRIYGEEITQQSSIIELLEETEDFLTKITSVHDKLELILLEKLIKLTEFENKNNQEYRELLSEIELIRKSLETIK